MQLPEIIKTGLDYIEQNLKTDIAAEELAQMAGYSTYHYYRLFSSVMGSSIAGYILKRRIDHALAEIADGRKSIEVVLEYGFDTYAGFYKAFVKIYGCSPKKYLNIYQQHKPNRPEVINMYTQSELKQILENWNIPKNLPLNDIYSMGGAKVSGNVWSVGDDYILKTGERIQLLKNLKVAKALANQNFTSALPVKTKSGDEYLNGESIFVLTHRIKGIPLPNAKRYGVDRLNYANKYGQSIARLHQALKSVQSDILPDEVNLYRNILDWVLPNVKKQNQQWNMGIDDSFFDDYMVEFGKLYDKLPKQLIHRDPNPSNILFSDGEVSGFIDFDLSEINVRLWDPCYCATGILSEDKSETYEIWPEILSGILHEYDSINPLTIEEKQSIFYVICSIEMICAVFFESRDEFKGLAKTNRKMFQFIIANKEKIQNIF